MKMCIRIIFQFVNWGTFAKNFIFINYQLL